MLTFNNNADNFFYCKVMNDFAKRMIWFSLFKLCFAILAVCILMFLTYDTLIAIVGFFFSNLFQSSVLHS